MKEWQKAALTKLSKLQMFDIYRIDIKEDEEQIPEIISEYMGFNPIQFSVQLRKALLEKNENLMPKIVQIRDNVLFAAVFCEEEAVLCGPFCLYLLSKVETHQYLYQYGIKMKEEPVFPAHGLSRTLQTIGLVSNLLNGVDYSEEELIDGNHMAEQLKKNTLSKEEIKYEIRTDLDEVYHHTYQKERELLDCVREGRVEDVLQKNMEIDVETGKLSVNKVTHWHNVAVVAITLSTRAAIEGGVTPSRAYQISDFYIQKSDQCKTIAELITIRNRAVEQLTTEVSQVREKKSASYVDQAKDYIYRNYTKKIYLDDVAEGLGITAAYLSRVFKKETGESFIDYITRFRVERAANMLVYSEESISFIAGYVNFPNQSYMGRVFKKQMGVTPLEYRKKNKPKEFQSN